MSDVFISYKREEADDFVKDIFSRLDKEGLSPWIDTKNIEPGMEWNPEIEEALKNSYALIAVMTDKAIESQFITYEWSYALGVGIPVIPIKCTDKELHPVLDRRQFVDVNDPAFYARLSQRLHQLQNVSNARASEKFTKHDVVEELSRIAKKPHNKDNEESKNLRKTAIKALGYIGGNQAESGLVSVLIKENKNEIAIVRATAEALGILQAQDNVTIQALGEILTKDNLADAARNALLSIGTHEALDAIDKQKHSHTPE